MNELINLVDAFERLWANGSSPDLDVFVSSVGAVESTQLSRLARIDQAERWQRGDRRSAEDYLDRYPELQADHDSAVDLIYHEYLLREKLAECPSLNEFINRFPQHAAVLAEQVGLHCALKDAENDGADVGKIAGTFEAPQRLNPLLPTLPAQFGRYRVLELLGRGAMGNVYLAEDSRLGRNVALKLPRLDREESPEAVDRFRREARIAATFHHPNLCPVYDFGEVDGTLFLTMPWLSGQALSARLQAGPLPEKKAAQIALAIARAMSVAHQAGVIHRDLKPANILLREDDEPVVMDFGLARRDLDLDPKLTGSGALVGTLAYMAPEQLHSTGDEVSAASDVYSLGVILYEMLTGRPPFEGTWQEVWEQIRSGLVLPPSKHVATLSPNLDVICLQAIAQRPQDRFASMDRFANALASYTEQDGSSATHRGVARLFEDRYRAAKRLVPRPTRAFSIAAVIAASILVVVGWFSWQAANRSWAAKQVPVIERLVEAGQTNEAYNLAVRVRNYIPATKLTHLMPRIANTLSVTSEPAGAKVYLRRFGSSSTGAGQPREFAGTTPLVDHEIARDDYVVSVEKEGYRPFQRTISGATEEGFEDLFPPPRIAVKLIPVADTPAGMVFVPGCEYRLIASRRPTDAQVELDDYWIDRCEVTNRQYQDFVNAGGYRYAKYWAHRFMKDGRTLSFEQAMEEFIDRTGLRSPRNWSGGTYPEGTADHPVTGITWYEAAAYAAFRKKRLPTVFQLENAARFKWDYDPQITPNNPFNVTMPWGLWQGTEAGRANLASRGTVAVGTLDFGMSPFGCYDMAGNVSEWCLNETSEGFIASGGSWNSLPQAWGYHTVYPGFQHSGEVGFRCVLNSAEASGDQGAMWINLDYEVPRFNPAPEEEVRKLLAHYDYEGQAPLNEHVERIEADAWWRERIAYDGAYGERAHAYLYLPKHPEGPHQVIHFVPAGDVSLRCRTVPQSIEADYSSFVRKGRAVFVVVLRGYLERDRPRGWEEPDPATIACVDEKARDVIDLRRGLDYLLTRNELDARRVAYMTQSRGDIVMALPAIEPRYNAAIFVGDGMGMSDVPWHQAANPVHFLPLIQVPSLLVHGLYDEGAPWKTAAEPLYNLLTKAKGKKMVPYDGGHRPDPVDLVPAVNTWLDKTWEPVTRK
jgi:formylglycine-generating enzyme required for sulfatase activity